MSDQLLNPRDIEFLLYEFLNTEMLLERPRYAEHSREVFNATLDTAQTLAEKFFAGHNAKGDANEPRFVDGGIQLIPETAEAWNAFAEAGFLAAHYDFDDGGMQMPEVILRTAMAYFSAANIATTAYPFLTLAAANLINTFGSDDQKSRLLPPLQDGRFAGTMALTEPDQGSSLADIRTVARADGNGGYRLYGQKMYISGGDQSLTENILHMVLARIEGAPAGTKGISLFVCPKYLIADDGTIGAANDVALAGLLHKMGYRNTTSTVLSFGEKQGAEAYLVGEANRGLHYMFQMMNEARIGVGLGAAALGYRGYLYSLEYARERPQGRPASNKDPASAQVRIIEHADVRRMLLAQKSYAEGSLALCLYASSLFEDSRTAATAQDREEAHQLLDLLTPVVKSWPSRYALLANDLAIQTLGGAGYIREYPVEQLYRDNRINPIHEGTEGIHGLDLLGRKVGSGGGAALKLFVAACNTTLHEATGLESIRSLAPPLEAALGELQQVTETLVKTMAEDPDRGLANANVYLDFFGRIVAAWIWLRQAVVAADALTENGSDNSDRNFYRGKLQAARYYIEWELPQTTQQAALLTGLNSTPLDMRDEWF